MPPIVRLPLALPRVFFALTLLVGAAGLAGAEADPAPADSGKAALTVTLVTPTQGVWPQTVSASGNITAWQEAEIGAEQTGQRLLEVTADVGQRVKKGQLLARMNDAAAITDLAQAQAQQSEAEAALAEARGNAARARSLREQGFYSAQALAQYLTAEQTAQARTEGARAAVAAAKLRLTQLRIVAPDDGIISAREAVVGSQVMAGQVLFRLIRQGRLEWRAEVAEANLAGLRAGLPAKVAVGDGPAIAGTVRTVSPAVDVKTRTAIVYVDVKQPGQVARAGMFARGEIMLGERKALSLPQSAVVAKDGFDLVYLATPAKGAKGGDKGGDKGGERTGEKPGDRAVVKAVRVRAGRRQDGRVEILSDLPAGSQVVASGGAFLADGDTVRVVAK